MAWGRGEDGQLGHGDADDRHGPEAVHTLIRKGVTGVHCGAEYTVAVCRERQEVYSWGWYGAVLTSCPQQDAVYQISIIDNAKCMQLRNMLSITCRGDFGRLGHGSCSDSFIPHPIKGLMGKGVIGVACGDTHTIALTADGKLYGFGRNQNGQLGLNSHTDQLHPTLIEALQVSMLLLISALACCS